MNASFQWRARPIAHRLTIAICIGLLIGTITGCRKRSTYTSAFDHASHADFTPDCSMCHDVSEPGDAALRPGHATCEMCHEIPMDAPDETCLTCHSWPAELEKTGEASDYAKLSDWLKATYEEQQQQRVAEKGDVIFQHANHEALACDTCHGDVLAEKTRDPWNMTACTDCHSERDVANDCETCHKVLREDVQPDTHTQGWTKAHGLESRIREKECAYCHKQSYCDDCHRTQQPDNHNAFFRKRGHGFFAENDRRNCIACHQVDFCEQCHQEVEPISHTTTFKSTRHCSQCHIPVSRGTKCQVCHREAVHPRSVPFAHPTGNLQSCAPCHTGRFITHSTTTIRSNQCGICHSQGARAAGFPHSIQGLPNCNICHTANLLEHPIFGSSERDCFTCHAGAPGPQGFIPHPIDLSVNCSICHPGSGFIPHPLTPFLERECRQCHLEGPRIPVQDLNAPHTLNRVPFERCSSCHTFTPQMLRELQAGGRLR